MAAEAPRRRNQRTRAITAALADLWTQILATVVLGMIIVGIAWIVLRGAAVARRRIRLTLDGPIGALWETIGRCGELAGEAAQL